MTSSAALRRLVINRWLSVDSPYLAETMSCAGFDCITGDVQHGMCGLGYDQVTPGSDTSLLRWAAAQQIALARRTAPA